VVPVQNLVYTYSVQDIAIVFSVYGKVTTTIWESPTNKFSAAFLNHSSILMCSHLEFVLSFAFPPRPFPVSHSYWIFVPVPPFPFPRLIIIIIFPTVSYYQSQMLYAQESDGEGGVEKLIHSTSFAPIHLAEHVFHSTIFGSRTIPVSFIF